MKIERKSVAATQIARNFVHSCGMSNWSVFVDDEVVVVTKTFAAGNEGEYADAEVVGQSLVDSLPKKECIIWGTRSHEISSRLAKDIGIYVLNIGGVQKMVVKAIAKELATS